MHKRILSLITALCFILNMLPLGVMAEEETPQPETIYAESTPEPEEEPQETQDAHASATVSPDATPETTEEPELTPGPTTDGTEGPSDEAVPEDTEADLIDCTRDASFSPAFVEGYAVVLEKDTMAEAEKGGDMYLPVGLVVYASGRDDDDKLFIRFDTKYGVMSGLTAADCLRPMSDTEVASYIEEETERPGVRFCDSDKKLPLDMAENIKYAEYAADISVSSEAVVLAEGSSMTLVPAFSDGGNYGYLCDVSDDSVVTWKDGLLCADAPGHAIVRFESRYGAAEVAVEVIALPDVLEVSISDTVVGAGDMAEIMVEHAGVLGVQYVSSDESIAVVDTDGVITAVAAGKCTITAIAVNGAEGSCGIEVCAAPSKLTLDKTEITLREDQTIVLQPVTDTGFEDDVVWTTSDAGVAVCENGVISCTAPGECVITASLYNGLTAECTVEVKAAPQFVSLPYSEIYIGVGETVQLEPDIGDAVAEISYKSSSTRYVKVSADGEIKGVRYGKATVKITTDNGMTFSLTVNVRKAPSKVTADAKSITLGVGETGQIGYSLPAKTAGSVTYSSENTSVATVDEHTGEVTAVSAGTTRICIRTYNGKKAYTKITVKNAPESVTIAPDTLVIGVGQTVKVKGAVNDGAAGKIAGYSEDADIASVSGSEITGVSVGSTRIVGETYNGVQVFCNVTVVPEPTEIILSDTYIELGVGESYTLSGETDNGISSLTYKSGSTRYATVNGEGVIKAVRAGTTKITVKTYNGVTAICTVKVYKAPSKVTASPTSMTLGVGETGRLSYKLPSKTYGRVTYSSENEKIATVDEQTGEVTAVSAGTTRICIRTYNGKKAYTKITVKKAPESVTIAPDTLVIGVGQTVKVKGAVNDGAAGKIEGYSEDADIASVSGSEITGVSVGSTRIVGETYNGVQGFCNVTVVPEPTEIVLSDTYIELGVGESYTLSGETDNGISSLTYKSGSTRYATVNGEGVIKAVRAGTTKITVKTYNGVTAICTVKVYKAPSKVTASPTSMTLGVGETGQLSYKLPSKTYGRVTYSSENEKIATVDEQTGEVTAVSAGTTRICIRTYNGKKAYTKITVKNAPEGVTITPDTLVIGVGQTVKVKGSVNDGAAGKIEGSSEDAGIASVSGSEITGVSVGSTRIVGETYNGVQGFCDVIVVPAPAEVILPAKTIYIGVGETYRLSADAGEGISEFKYSSSRTKYVTVDSEGDLYGRRVGTSTVKVTAYNGIAASCTVKVLKAPSKVTVKPAAVTLGVGETWQLSYSLPSNTAGQATYSSEDTSVVEVDAASGVVTAVGTGTARVCVRTYNGKKAYCTVTVYAAPESVTLNAASVVLGVGESFAVVPSIPENSFTRFTFAASGDGAVDVTDDGFVTATLVGDVTLRVGTHVPDVYADMPIAVMEAPAGISLAEDSAVLQPGETYALQPVIPAGSSSAFTYSCSDTEHAVVDENGVITALKHGNATITVSTYNGHSAVFELEVYDPYYPTGIELLNEPDVLDAKVGTYAMDYVVTPDTAVPELMWSSSNSKVATVDENGVITLKGYGYSTITVVSAKNEDVTASFVLAVQTDNVVLVIPARTTDAAGIDHNLMLIDNIRLCAVGQVTALYKGGVISAADAKKRISMINNVFDDYAFPWQTPALQPYWKEANSENGLKDFKPGIVYYGMPYQSEYLPRRYDREKAVSQNRFYDTGLGYYMLNQDNPVKGTYAGNDCSSLLNAAIWGTSSSHAGDRTGDIATSSSYKTVKDFKSMRPGDLICWGGRHVVMFLYYANPEKTKIMIIENGGDEAGTNTVHCAVHDVSYYTSRGYKVRRLRTLD